VWFHGTVGKTDCEAILVEASGSGIAEDGQFFVRQLPGDPDSFGLVVGFSKPGKPCKTTHHLITRGDDGVLSVNKKVLGAGHTNLIALIDELGGSVAGWPVPLIKPVAVPANGLAPSVVLPSRASSTRGATTEATFAEEDSAPWIHGEISRADAEALLRTVDSNGQLVEGTWLVRKRGPFEPTSPEYIIVVVFEARVTNHLVQFDESSCTLNGEVVDGVTTIEQLIEVIKTMPQFWKAPLQKFVPVGTTASARAPSATMSGGLGEIAFTLTASGTGFGLKLDGGKAQGGVFIMGASPGSAASAHPEIVVGRQIVSIDGTSMENAAKADCVAAIKGRPSADIVVREEPVRFAGRHLPKQPTDVVGSVMKLRAKTQAGKNFGLRLSTRGRGTVFVDAVEHLSAASLAGTFRSGMRLKSVNGADFELEDYELDEVTAMLKDTEELLIDAVDDLPGFNGQGAKAVPTAAKPIVAKAIPTEAKVQPARPDYDDHGASDVLRGGTLGESTVDESAFSFIMPPADRVSLRRYVAQRPKVQYHLERHGSESWGFTIQNQVPMVVDTVTSNGVAYHAQVEIGDIVCDINGVSILDDPAAAIQELNRPGTVLTVLATKYWLGGITYVLWFRPLLCPCVSSSPLCATRIHGLSLS
jgi:hypothetical protein